MTFSQKSDVQKHLAHPMKKTHYLNQEEQVTPAEKIDESGADATLLDDKEPISVVNAK